MTTVAPYGTWSSPLTPAAMATQGRRYGFVSIDLRGAPVWCEQRPDEGGRVVVCRLRADASIEDLTPEGFNARTRVHEYGGAPYVLDGDVLWCAGFDDQRLARIEGAVVTLRSTGDGWRFAEPLIDARRGRLLAVAERHAPGARHPSNGIASVDAVTGDVRWVIEGHDFVSSPALSPDGTRLAYIAWDHPHMRWDAAALYLAPVSDDGSVGPAVCITGGPDASVNELLWRDDTSLLFTLEVDDRWQPFEWREGVARRVADVPGELGAPMWVVGTRTLALPTRETLLCVAQRAGRSALVSVDLGTGAPAAPREAPAHIGAIAVCGDALALIAGFNSMGPAVLYAARRGEALRVIAGALPEASAPEAITFATSDGDVAHGFFYRPHNPDFSAPEGTLPPLLVTAHGGPTGCAGPLPASALLFWTSRGFAVLDVNYRGSSGFGRAYREKLRGRWGVVDVIDCVHGARHLVAAGRVRADALFIRGASAGGYTVLQALCDHEVFHGGACLYGVSDPRSLMADTHKLESRYDAFLFGTGDDFERAMRERTPLDHPERIRVPVVFFQGREDLAVLPSQTIRIHEALRARGLASELNLYDGEQHGFRRAETIIDVFSRELGFYLRCLGADLL